MGLAQRCHVGTGILISKYLRYEYLDTPRKMDIHPIADRAIPLCSFDYCTTVPTSASLKIFSFWWADETHFNASKMKQFGLLWMLIAPPEIKVHCLFRLKFLCSGPWDLVPHRRTALKRYLSISRDLTSSYLIFINIRRNCDILKAL